jgi:ACS family hexuronate transporter-like MFS transporter
MSSPTNKSNLRWVVCGLLFMATAINYMDRTALGLVEPMLKHILGGDQDIALYNRRYSDIVNCFIFAYGLGFLVAGRVVDRIGVKKGYALSIGVWALASLSHVFARTPFGFGLARFALGIGESGNFPSALKATADWFPAEERALATGIFNSGTSAGAVIAPMMIPWVAVRYGWQAAFYTTSSLGLLWFIGWLLFPYNTLQPRFGSTTNRSAAAAAAPPAAYKSLLFSPNTWRFALSKGTTDAIWWFYLFWLPKYFNERFHVDMQHLGLPLIIVYVGATIGSIFGGWLAGFYIRRGHSVRMGRRFAMLVCALCVMPVALVPFVHPLWQAIALLCLAAAAHQGWSSNLLSTPSDMFPSSSVGTVVGIGGAVGAAGSVLFTFLVGLLWTNYALVIFFAAGSIYVLTLFAFQWRAPAPLAAEQVSAD